MSCTAASALCGGHGTTIRATAPTERGLTDVTVTAADAVALSYGSALMARKVDEFPDAPSQARYPWDEWLDGDVWELIAGEDFNGKPESLRSVADVQARKRGGRIQARLIRSRETGQPDRIYLRFVRDKGSMR
jgi:hypothetical protein